jgi:hypothetical protein
LKLEGFDGAFGENENLFHELVVEI